MHYTLKNVWTFEELHWGTQGDDDGPVEQMLNVGVNERVWRVDNQYM